MCLIVFAWRAHPDYPLIVAANRDEYHARPAEPMGTWDDRPTLLAGRDAEAGGTWLGITRSGRFAAVTNYRERPQSGGERSRGEIVTGFADGDLEPLAYVESLPGEQYAGYSVLAANPEAIAYGSNRGDAARVLAPGVYGLSNSSLDTPWTKLTRTRDALADRVGASRPGSTDDIGLDVLIELMADRRTASVEDPSLPFEIARAVSAAFVLGDDYGTRCSTALICRADGHVEALERRFDAAGETTGESRFTFQSPDWRNPAGTW